MGTVEFPMRPHDAYLEVSAPTHRRYGEVLGQRLAEGVRHDARQRQATPTYAQDLRTAQPYWERTRQAFPHLAEEVEGYAAGAGISLEDAWLLCLEDELVHGEHCTTAVTNGGALIAHNEDWDQPEAVDRLFVLRRTVGPHTSLELYYRNTLGGNAVGVNRRGLVQAVNSLHCADESVGVPRNIVARHASDADSAAEAVQRIALTARGSGYAHLLVDAHETVCVESSASHVASWRPSLPFYHANTMLHPSMTPLQKPGSYHGSAGRLRSAKFHVVPKMTPQELATAFDDQTQGPEESLHNEDTIGRVIVDRVRGVFRVWLKREANRGWVDYPLP